MDSNTYKELKEIMETIPELQSVHPSELYEFIVSSYLHHQEQSE